MFKLILVFHHYKQWSNDHLYVLSIFSFKFLEVRWMNWRFTYLKIVVSKLSCKRIFIIFFLLIHMVSAIFPYTLAINLLNLWQIDRWKMVFTFFKIAVSFIINKIMQFYIFIGHLYFFFENFQLYPWFGMFVLFTHLYSSSNIKDTFFPVIYINIYLFCFSFIF